MICGSFTLGRLFDFIFVHSWLNRALYLSKRKECNLQMGREETERDLREIKTSLEGVKNEVLSISRRRGLRS